MSDHPRSDQPSAPASAGATRREFVATTAAAAAAWMIVPRHVLGQGQTPPSDLVNIAVVGINGMGAVNAEAVMSQNIVAICDADEGLLDAKIERWKESLRPPKPNPRPPAPRPPRTPPPTLAWNAFGPSTLQRDADAAWPAPQPRAELQRFVDQQLPRLEKYADYREMLEKQRDLDGVIIATPDHMHAPIASAAMAAGKHVYVQKPMCWSVAEARHLAKQAAANPKLVTQMGNQGHSTDDARRGQDYLAAGIIGEIREIHVWTNRPLGYWPQGVPRPKKFDGKWDELGWGNRGITDRLANAFVHKARTKTPKGLHWDLFLGAAPPVEYHPLYHPFNWRGWVDWGQGALGDMGAHLVDHPVWGLKLGLPTTIETISTPFNNVSYPNATTTHYEFPARDGMPAVKMTWYDGGFMPARPVEMGDVPLEGTGGVLYVGSKGKMLQDNTGAKPRLLPLELHNGTGAPPEKMPRVPHQHHEMNWVNAIRGRDTISCPFAYAAHLTEIMLLGIAALRAGTRLEYDGAAMRVTNVASGNDLLTRQYRPGFGLA
ncbi:MAG TPA: Gfo/Idh/MocA family oxidoreductase [Vicinamibacterales bacterium]|nr:Gfo/Idh/MocA family oxidoreductase [Vicinamibacterales bacterium]